MNIEGRVFDIVCCDKTEGAADKVPVKNDILRRNHNEESILNQQMLQ